jgi:hypothetical protein
MERSPLMASPRRASTQTNSGLLIIICWNLCSLTQRQGYCRPGLADGRDG